MKQVSLDDDVFEAIQIRAEPLVDDINSVLRRILRGEGGDAADLAHPRHNPSPPRAERAVPGSILPEHEYQAPILIALMERNGSAHATEITDAVGELLGDRLTELDREPLNSGDIRWRNRVQFTRLTLRKLGLLRSDSPRGIWELTDKGREEAKKAAG